MKKSYLHVFSVLTTALVLLAGCRSEIQLDKIDPTIEAQMKLALPIGSISAKVSDFLGTSDSAEFYIDTLNGKGVVTYHRTMTYEKELTDFDIKSKIGSKTYYVNIYDMLKNAKCDDGQGHEAQLMDANGDIDVPAGYKYSNQLDFEVPLIIDGVNKAGTEQRVDSARFDNADFFVKVTRNNFDDLQWDWIDTIKVDLTEQIKYTPSQMMVVYKRGDNATWGAKLAAKLQNIVLDMMKNHNLAPSSSNVYNNIPFNVYVKYTIPGGTHAHVNQTSGLDCEFGTDRLDVNAVWGWFSDGLVPYSQDIKISYDPFTFLNGARLPLSNPIIDAHMRTKIAGNLLLEAEIYTTDSAGNKHHATWDGEEKMHKVFTEADGCINPITSSINDESNISIHFDGDPANGDIDNLLTEMPRAIYYSVSAGFDKVSTPQVRVAGDVYVKADATAKVPIDFHKGIKIDYSDTIKGIKLEEASIDSLLKEVNWVDTLKTTNVHVYATIYNGIPLDVKGTFYCLDENNNKIMDPNNPSEVWSIFPDTLNLAGGTYDTGTREVTPAKSLAIAEMTKERLDLFPKIKSIVYYAYVVDDCVKDATFGAQINGTNNVKVTLGLTADIDAIINLANVNVKDAKL